jgi:uncharacterized repeat protein (TIGR01451 family)
MKKHKTTFKRLVSNLPYNPSLISQVAFYTKRLKQETSIRRLGFLFIALTFLVQLFAVIAPPKSSIASAGNDIKPGGFYSHAEGVAACRSNMNNYGAVLAQLGVTCDNLANGVERKIDYSEQGGQLYSIGYVPQGFAGEQPIDLPNIGVRVWARPLTSWGPHCYNDGRGCLAIVGTDDRGRFFMVLFACGNLVTVGPPTVTPPQPPPPPPPPTPVKVINCALLSMNVTNGSHVPLGSTISVQGQASGLNLPAGELVNMYYDNYNAATKVTSPTQPAIGIWFTGNTAYDQTARKFKMDTAGHYIFRLTVKYENTKVAAGSAVGNCVKDVYVDADTCKNPNDHDKCEVKNKRAKNITRNIPDANGTTANPGDVIEYTLAITNTLKATTVKGFVIKDQIGDILEYADLVDTGGGKLDAQKNLVYPAVDIKASQTVEKKFTVKVKDPVPSTPVSSSDPGSFDLTMTNVYGDTIKIKVPPKGVKIIEATKLPNTGPGENMAIAFVLTAVVGYFFFRSRLLTKELDLVREEYTAGA